MTTAVVQAGAGQTYTFNVDLYGFARSASSAIPTGTANYYEGAAAPTAANGSLIQDDFYTTDVNSASDLTLNQTITSNSAGNNALTAYLNAQYAGGAGAGQFVFIRANPDSDSGNLRVGFNFASGNDANVSHEPTITYTLAAAPEPGLSMLLCLGTIVAGLRRRR